MRRISRPSPAMVVASVALFVSLGGTSVAAVNYARNAGKVDGYDAVKASSSTSKAAGRLVAANKSGPDKGRVPGSHLADVPLTQTFGRAYDVADNAPGAPVVIGDAGTLGTLTATCNDQSAQAAIEDPLTELNFVNSSGGFINVAKRVGIREDGSVTAVANGTVAPLVDLRLEHVRLPRRGRRQEPARQRRRAPGRPRHRHGELPGLRHGDGDHRLSARRRARRVTLVACGAPSRPWWSSP